MKPRTFFLLFIAFGGSTVLGISWISGGSRDILGIVGHALVIIPIIIILIQSYIKMRFLYDYFVPSDIPFRVLSTDVNLDIQDDEGKLAKYRKTQTCKVLKNGVTGYRTSAIEADGRIENFRVGGQQEKMGEAIPLMKLSDRKTYEARVEFDKAYNRGDKVSRIIELEYHDSFIEDREYFKISFVYPVQVNRTRITWPNGYNIDKIYLEERLAIEENLTKAVTWLTIKKDDGSCYVEHEIHKPKVGTIATFVWERKS